MRIDKAVDALGLTPVDQLEPAPTQQVLSSDRSNDDDMIRGNLLDIIDQGQKAVKEMMGIAKLTESPTAYMAAAKILDAVVTANRQLMEANDKYTRRRAIEEAQGSEDNQDHHVVRISHAALVKQLLEMKKNEQAE